MQTKRQHKQVTGARSRRRLRVRARVTGTAERPRLTVFRSLRHISAQIVNDEASLTLVAANDREANATGAGVARAVAVGALIAEKAKKQKISRVVFDRRGYRYHGQVKALADAARKQGLEF